MKIFYISKAILPSEISNSLSIMRMCQAFTDNGHEVVLTGIVASKSSSGPIKYYGLRGGFEIIKLFQDNCLNNRVTRFLLLPGLYLALKNRKFIHKFKPDLIYSRLTILELALVPKSIPILYEMHSLGPLGNCIHRYVFKWLIRRKNFKRIVVTTDFLAKRLKNELPDIDIVVARLSAEPPIQVPSADLNSFKEEHFLGEGFKWHVGYTGCLDTVGLRGTDVICKTAARMPEAAFHIVGGSQEIVDYWKGFSIEYNQHGNIFFYGYRNPAEMPYFLGNFDVVLAPLQFRPSRRAPLGQNLSPLKLPQYMAYAKSIVASDIPMHREILKHEDNSLLVPCDNIPEWVQAISTLLKDESLRKHIQNKAQKGYYYEFTPKKRVERIINGFSL